MLLTKRKDGTGRILSKVLTEQTKASEVLPKKGGDRYFPWTVLSKLYDRRFITRLKNLLVDFHKITISQHS